MGAISILRTVYHLPVCLWMTALTLGVKISQCDSAGLNGNLIDQDIQNCTASLCLPDSQCSYYSAFIQSPNYPRSYPASQDVYWFLKLIKNISVDDVVITVEDFHVERDHDWVNIGIRNHLDGRTVQESLTGILKPGQTFRIPFSFGVQVYVHFHSDNTIQLKGFRLSYIMVPKDPRRVQILKLKPTSVLLRWDSLVAKSMGNITYKVYHGPYGEQTTLAGNHLVTSAHEYNLTGLTAATSYFVYVVALVNCGQEDIGRLINFTTTSHAPGDLLPPPLDLGVMEVECGTILVSWSSPDAAGSRVIGYRVHTVTEEGAQVKATQAPYITLRNLRTDQDYNITAITVDSQGESPPSNQVTIRLQRCKPGEAAQSLTPMLAHELRYRVRSSSLLIQLPACVLLHRIERQLRQKLTVWVLMVEDEAGVVLPSYLVPGGQNATYGHTDIGRRGVYVAHHHLPCYDSQAKVDPIRSFGIFKVGSEKMCSPTGACNGPLRSNTTYRLRYVLMGDESPILFSQWSEPLTTRTVVPHQEIQLGQRKLSTTTVSFTSTLTALCLWLSLCLLGVCYWRLKRTDRWQVVWRSLALRRLNPVQQSGVGATHGEVSAESSTSGYGRETPQH